MNPRRVEERHVGVRLLDEHPDLRAAFDHALGALFREIVDDVQILRPRILAHLAEAEFVVDHPVHDFTGCGVRRQHLDALRLQAATVEILLHGETGAKEADACQTRCADARRGGVGQMQQGNIDGCFDLRRDPMMRHYIWSPLELQGVESFDAGAAILRFRMRTAPLMQWDVARAFNLRLKRRFDELGLDVAMPRMSVSLESSIPEASGGTAESTSRAAGMPQATGGPAEEAPPGTG